MLDTFQQIDWVALLRALMPLFVILLAAGAALIYAAFSEQRKYVIEAGIAAVGLVIAIACAWHLWPLALAVKGTTLATDRLAMVGIIIVGISTVFVTVISPAYFTAREECRSGYYALVLLSALGMSALVLASDLISMLIAIETTSLTLYALTGYLRKRPASVEGALKYFIMGAFATAFFCMGIAFIFGSLGSTDLNVIANRSAFVSFGEGRSVFLFGLAMIVAGLAFKVAAVPFHAWAPDAYDGAPTPVSMLLATAAKAAAFIAFLRLALAIAGPGGLMWHHLAWGLSAATIIWGNLAALRQQNIKRMLAYSSIAHAGYMLIAFPLLAMAPVAMARALMLYLVAYVISTAGAFAAVSAFGLAPGEPVDIRHLSGFSKKKPLLSAGFALFLISLAGFPPTLGFFGKYYLFMEAVKAGDVGLVVLAVLGTVVSVYYYLRPVVVMYMRKEIEKEMTAASSSNPAAYTAVITVLALAALAIIVFGILPQDLVALIQASAQ
ncbi:MAG: NADH-quinone oxidoreductase subunit N [Pseudomonadota bacterium]